MRIAASGACADVALTRDGVMVVTWGGVVTHVAAELVKGELCASLAAPPGAIVSDYRRAAIAMSDAEVRRIMLGGRHDMPDLPAVVVASPATCNRLADAAVTAALAGRWRHVALEPARALSAARQIRAAVSRHPAPCRY